MAQVEQHGEHREGSTQYVLATRNPDYRLHVKGMDTEEQRSKQAAPDAVSHGLQHPEEERCRDDMKQQIRRVVTPRIKPEEFRIEHQGEPGKRAPIGIVDAGEGPPEPAQTEPLAHHRIARDITGVIQGDEGGRQSALKEHDHHQRKQHRQGDPPLRRHLHVPTNLRIMRVRIASHQSR